MTIRKKLIVATVSVSIAIVALGGCIVCDSIREMREMESVRQFALFCDAVSSLVHETQKERGLTAGFLGSSDEKFVQRLSTQRQLTDEKMSSFRAVLESLDLGAYGKDVSGPVHLANDELSGISQKRNLVSSRKLDLKNAIAYYTHINTLLLDTVNNASRVATDGRFAVRISAYSAFLKSKERAGLERAVLANAFAKDRFGPGLYDKFSELVALQNTYLQEFVGLASPEDRDYFESTLTGDVITKVDWYREIARSKSMSGGFGQDPGVWFDTITKKINLLKKVDDELSARLVDQAESAVAKARRMFCFASFVVIATCSLVAIGCFVLVRSISSRLEKLASSMRHIAEGDLTIRLTESDDEIGKLSTNVNLMLSKMSDAVLCISRHSSSISESSDSLTLTADTLKSGADQSKTKAAAVFASTEEIATNMAQTSVATTQMSEGIAEICESVELIRSFSDRVTNESKQTASFIESAAACVENGNQQVHDLGIASRAIDNVINIIQELSEQTSLLALNATIEAARAGEAGKGFAVVATEVKQLASQSSQAIEGIRDQVTAIQGCAEQTVAVVGEVEKLVCNARESTRTIAVAIDSQQQNVASIIEIVAQSKAASDELSQAINESASATTAIAENMAHVDDSLRCTVEGADHTRTCGTKLANLTADLKTHVNQFTIEHEPPAIVG